MSTFTTTIERVVTSSKVFKILCKDKDILQISDLYGLGFEEISLLVLANKARWVLEQYLETISNHERVDLSNTNNDYDAALYMHLKVCWELNRCWLEMMLSSVEKSSGPAIINIIISNRGEVG